MTNKELIEFVFYHEKEIKQAVFERREDGCLPKTGGSGSGHCRVSDPTAQNAIRKALEVPAVMIEYGAKTCGRRNSIILRYPEKWLKVIAVTRGYFGNRTAGKVYALRYCNCRTREEILDELSIRKSQYHAMVAGIIKFAEGVAVCEGLIYNRY